jgi:uncharacterized membrane protein
MNVKAFKNVFVLYFTLFAIALGSRLPGITFHSLWFDEISTANMVSQASYGDLLKAVNTIEGTPPLFFIIEKAFLSWVGLPANEFSLRLLPLIFGVMASLLFYKLFKNIGGSAIGIQAFILYVCSSFLINQAQEARCYSMLGCVTLLTLLAVFRWWKSSGIGNTIALCLILALAIQIHYHTLLWIGALFIAIFITKPKDRRLGLFFLYSGVSVIISLALLLPILISQILHVVGPFRDYLTQKWFPGLIYVPVKVMIGSYLFKINSICEITTKDLLGIIPVIIILCVALWHIFRQWRARVLSDDRTILILNVLISFLLFAMVGWKVSAVHPRYMAHFTVLILGIVLLALEKMRNIRMTFIAVLIVLNVIGIAKYYDTSRAYIEPWREIGRALDEAVAAGKDSCVTIVTDMPIAHTIAYYSVSKSAPIYQIPGIFDTFSYTRTRLFGHPYIASMPHYLYYPEAGKTSTTAVMREKKSGIFLDKKIKGHTKLPELTRDFKGLVSFTLLRYFKTNQGDVCIYRWVYKG